MALDRVQPLKIEDTGTGDEVDLFPTALDRNEDFVDCHGVTLQDTESDDDAVVLGRDEDGNLTFLDVANTVKTLTDLVAGTGGLTAEGHKILRQLIHFIDDGPAEGFASGAYKEVTGTVFPTAVVWYDSSGVGKKKIVEKLLTWAGVNATTIVWKIYDAAETLLATVTDTISYSGVFETSRTRAIA
jgi:hypothetical protein